jgi:hypothetical protein
MKGKLKHDLCVRRTAACAALLEIEIRVVKPLAASVRVPLNAGSPETLGQQSKRPNLEPDLIAAHW